MANDQHRPIDHAGLEVLAAPSAPRLLHDHRVGAWLFSKQASPGCFPWSTGSMAIGSPSGLLWGQTRSRRARRPHCV